LLYEMTVPPFIQMLENLDRFFVKAVAHAEARRFDAGVLLTSRLAPDQFHLIRQVQIACDAAKLCAARLAGKTAPKHDDGETTLAELQARIRGTVEYLRSFGPSDFEGAAERRITTPRWEGRHLTGWSYATAYALPNFYFHVTTAYSILRHNGVDVGKADYLGPLPYVD
jgi:uncharacterized protein